MAACSTSTSLSADDGPVPSYLKLLEVTVETIAKGFEHVTHLIASVRAVADATSRLAASIAVRDLTVTYPNGTTALRDASFELGPGTICGLVGVNGSRQVDAVQGHHGLPVARRQARCGSAGCPCDEALKRNLVAYVPQSGGRRLELPGSGRDVVMMGRYGHMGFLRRPSRDGPRKVDEALERVGMTRLPRAPDRRAVGRPEKARVPGPRAGAGRRSSSCSTSRSPASTSRPRRPSSTCCASCSAQGHLMLVSTHNLGSVPDFCDQVVLVLTHRARRRPDRDHLHAGQSGAGLRRRAAPFPPRGRGAARGRRSAQRHGADRRRAARGVLRRAAEPASKPPRGTARETKRDDERAAEPLRLRLHGQGHVGVGALVGGACAFLSAFLMLKGWSLMGDALAHSIVPGVAGAYLSALPYAAGAFFAGMLAALGMAFVRSRRGCARTPSSASCSRRSSRRPADGLDQPDLGQRAVDRARQHPRHLRRGRDPGRHHQPPSRSPSCCSSGRT